MENSGSVRDVIQFKGDHVWSTTPDATVYEAIGLMGEKDIGALVVLNEKKELVGVLSERDYSRKVVLQGRTSRDTRVCDILDQTVISVNRKDSIAKCMQLMTEHRIRHLPVVVDTRVIGLVSMGDLVKFIIETQKHTIMQLQGYISGDYPG